MAKLFWAIPFPELLCALGRKNFRQGLLQHFFNGLQTTSTIDFIPDPHIRAFAALFETERTFNSHEILQILLGNIFHKSAKNVLRTAGMTTRPDAHLNIDTFRGTTLDKRKTFGRKTPPALIFRMKQMMGLFTADLTQVFRI